MSKPSEKFSKEFGFVSPSVTDSNFVYEVDGCRFSILSPQILRVESGEFTDLPTQAVVNRCFDSPAHKFAQNGKVIKISTSKAIFEYHTGKKRMLSVKLIDGRIVTDYKSGNLKGTYRTLDGVNGSCKIGDGLLSTNGVTIINDSKSCLLNADGTISERPKCKDEYYLAFGFEYIECIRQFYKLCGPTPLIPRFALSNWWSRFRKYTQEEYLNLMRRFTEEEIPITVSTIDMDWHWTDVEDRFGKQAKAAKSGSLIHDIFDGGGWTGYSWNTELFPDYKAMLKQINNSGRKIAINLHPAQGIRFFEDMYGEMAKFMGIDPASMQIIPFDFTDPKFIEGYFDIIHRPYERDGVNIWWIDWQQGKDSNIKGLDPLWALNHYHTIASTNGGKTRPLILSRFAEVGSHRFPLGFSGDTSQTWDSLAFQPYFTLAAANIGYSWWSHDIGGHHFGYHDDELYLRWMQFGQYSPIMRLHSTANDFMGKEPWKFSRPARDAAVNALRGRHALLPYIYTQNYLTHTQALPICMPLYFKHPKQAEAYRHKNEYFFGSELLVAPITKKVSKKTHLASTDVWLPDGRWTDIYTGFIYDGNKELVMLRDVGSIPVLAKEGAILPLSENDRINDCSNPVDMLIRVWRGNGSFTLYEDDGISLDYQNGSFAETKLTVKENGKQLRFVISPVSGDLKVLPAERNYTISFDDVSFAESCNVSVNGKNIIAEPIIILGKLNLKLSGIKHTDEVVITLVNIEVRKNDKYEIATERLSSVQMINDEKRLLFNAFLNDNSKPLVTTDKDILAIAEEIRSMK